MTKDMWPEDIRKVCGGVMDSLRHSITFQEIEQQSLFEPITKKTFTVKDTSQFEKIRLDGVKFSKTNSEITAIYDKNKLKFDQIIDVVKNNAEILDISTDEGDLEDIFLQVTNK